MFHSSHITPWHRTRPHPRFRPRLEPMEDRTVPSSVGGVVQDSASVGLSGWRVWLDNINNNSILDDGETSTITDASGRYSFDTTLVTAAGKNTATGVEFDRVRLDLQVGTDGRWLNTTVQSVNVPRADNAVANFGVKLQPYVDVGVAPLGGQSLVNVTTAGQQGTISSVGSLEDRNVSVSADSQGNYVVTWLTYSNGGTDRVSARVFNANGSARTGEITVASGPAMGVPKVAMAGNGLQFTVSWGAQNGSLLAQTFRAADGTTLNGPVTLFAGKASKGSGTSAYQPSVALDDVGNGVVLYFVTTTSTRLGNSTPTLKAQRFTAAGTTSGSAFTVASPNIVNNSLADVAMDSKGNFVVAWHDAIAYGSSYVYAQRYDASGHKVGGQITVAESADGTDWMSSVAMNATGQFVVTYSHRTATSNLRMARLYSSNGTPSGPAVAFADNVDMPVVAIDSAGNVTFAWTSDGEVRMRRLTSTGVLGAETIVNTTTQGMQVLPGVAATGNGSCVIVWQGYGPEDDLGIYAQRFGPLV